MDKHIKARLKWVNLYRETQDAGYVCRRFGISRPGLRKWYHRYQQSGEQGLKDHTRKPHYSTQQKITEQPTQWTVTLRQTTFRCKANSNKINRATPVFIVSRHYP